MGPPRATFHGFIVTQSEMGLSSRSELRRAWQPFHEPKKRLPARSRQSLRIGSPAKNPGQTMPPWRLAIISCQLIIDTCISTRLDRDIGRGAPSCAAFDRTTTVRKKVPALPPFGGILYQDHLRRPADEDVGPSGPGPFFSSSSPHPCCLMRFNTFPPVFPEIKRIVDRHKRQRFETVLRPDNLFRMTGSNLLLSEATGCI